MNMLLEIVNFISSALTPYAVIRYNAFQDLGEEIIIVPDPSNATEITYLDGTKQGENIFSIQAKSRSGETARQQLEVIKTVLDLSRVNIAGVRVDKIECITNPTFLVKTDSSEYVYSASFRLEYTTI